MTTEQKLPYQTPTLTPLGALKDMTASGSRCNGPYGHGPGGTGDCGKPHQP